MATPAKKLKDKTPKKSVPKVAPAKKSYFQGVGRRKLAISRTRVFMSAGKDSAKPEPEILVNGIPHNDFFALPELKEIVASPLKAVRRDGIAKISVSVRGGGIRGQAEATRLAISRALVSFDPELKKTLRDIGYLTRDSRITERKKAGLKKARRAPQFSKR